MIKAQTSILGLDGTGAPDSVVEDEELNELERLAGVAEGPGTRKVSLLDISDDEEEEEAPVGDVAPVERPSSVGAESSYSDFMQQWKNKLA